MPEYTDNQGRTYDTLKAMLEANGIAAQTYYARRRAGKTGGQLFAKPKGRRTDAEGRTYSSQKEMLEANGLSPGTYHSRLKAGKTGAELLAAPANAACRDHTGQVFENRGAMAKAYGITKAALAGRLRKGWPLKCALLVPMSDKSVRDHHDRKFDDRSAMAKAYKMSPGTVGSRLKKGWSVENALTKPPGRKNPDRLVEDHAKQKFETVKAMCAHWGIDPQLYRKRRKSGMTLEQALTTPVGEFMPPRSCRDHEGTEYPNWKAMCLDYSLDPEVVKDRLEKGWSLERALTEPARHPEEKTDWAGRTYATITEMAERLHVSRNALKYRIKPGPDQSTASAETCASFWPGTAAGEYDILKCVSFPWFLCVARPDPNPDIHAGELLLHADVILALKQDDRD